MDKYSQELMTALTSDNYQNAVKKYLFTFDLENWKIFTDNYFKLTPYEAEKILEVFENNLDFHMIIDIISIAHIIGQSIALSSSLIRRFTKINVVRYEKYITANIDRLLKSSIAEERRIGLLLAGYFDRDDFFDEIERLTNYDILFEDAYYALGLMTAPKIIELLGTKFMLLNKNHIQRKAIAKILANKGNPLAALWLYRSKEFDFTTPYTKGIYIARELAWSGIKPSLLLKSDDDFLQPITLRFVEVLAVILSYDLDLVTEIELEETVTTLLSLLENEPNLDLSRTIYTLKLTIDDIYNNIDPYNIQKEIRENIINSWKKLQTFPSNKTINFLKSYVFGTLDINDDDFLYALRIIRNFNLKEFESEIIAIAKNNQLTDEQAFEVISCLGAIGNVNSIDLIPELLQNKVDYKKRYLLSIQNQNYHSELDYIDDFDNELLVNINRSFEPSILKWFNTDFNEIFYWNALYALGNLKSEKYLPILIEALDDYDPKIRFQAINSLKRIGILTEDIEEKLISIAKFDSFMSVQREALLALGQLNSQTAIQDFIEVIFKAIEEGVLELTEEVDHVIDNRWEVELKDDTQQVAKDVKEIGATSKVRKSSMVEENLIDQDISRWISRLNKNISTNLELREDITELDQEINEEMDYYDSTDFESITDHSEFYTESEENQNESEDEWLSELGEQFRKLTIVESAIEALKLTKAKIPTKELKELLEHPIDEELYKDILIILAKNGNSFAINELIGLFNIVDYTRARNIVEIFQKVNPDKRVEIISKINDSVDWLLKEKIKNQ
ncbi:MAG: HEAT repeat domain-containing protein [Asgard group archaeon]|nr:HEAT repeat domain-containing protein [Asgard group archaeon]